MQQIVSSSQVGLRYQHLPWLVEAVEALRYQHLPWLVEVVEVLRYQHLPWLVVSRLEKLIDPRFG
jgi:hypothetical protein